MARSRVASTVRLKPADPFELVRLLARSQSDPRKAVAELVQNSLDAGSTNVAIRRHRIRGIVCLSIRDDGDGVLPELPRDDALRYLATHVGHSRKRGLDAAQRAEQVISGQYGVGLLGFWAIGKILELRTRVGGGQPMALRLEEDSPSAQILILPGALDDPPQFTEALVSHVHETALKPLGGRRLADYLASELRGQILARDVRIVVHDDLARGIAQKTFPVVPKRFSGERLPLPAEIPVEGHAPLRVELYLARGAERPAIQIACAGTLVADDVTELGALGLVDEPWIGRDVVGLVDFSGFRVPPGTRRGVIPDDAAGAFAAAMDRLAPLVLAELARLDAERREAVDRNVVKELRRALRGFEQRLPHYELPRINAPEGPPANGTSGAAPVTESEAEAETQSTDEADDVDLDLALFAPGPLASVRIVPPVARVTAGGVRRLSAVCTDADGQRIRDVLFKWSLDAETSFFTLDQSLLRGTRDAKPGATCAVHVVAHHGGKSASADASAVIVEDTDDGSSLGIPEPVLVSDADGSWRSRMSGARWEVNDAHPDYRAMRAESRQRLRYLLSLLGKEIVLRSSGRTEIGPLLESLVEILVHAERNLGRKSDYETK